MKKYALLFCLFATILMSCDSGSDSDKTDSLKKDSVAVVFDPGTPHQVKKDKGGVYAFMPDTSIQSIILGNPDCLNQFYRKNGSNEVSLGNGRKALTYYNNSSSGNQEMELRITENENSDDVVYAFIVQQKGNKNAPPLSAPSIPASDINFVSGHGIYIGMPLDHVMSVYSNQAFMEWEKGDTVYLEYKPQPKDVNYFKRYKPESYKVMYKFKDGSLRRMEYSVDPKQFEKK